MLYPEFDFIEFKNKCLNSPSRIYGFIVYTRAHSYIAKVLRDEDFWYELDEISGPNWPIFAVRPLEQGCYKMPSCSRKSKSNICCSMNEVWYEPNENKKVLEWFALDKSEDLPCMVIFSWNDNDKLERFVWKLSNDSLDNAFNLIREVVKIVTETESYILPKYKKSISVYRNVRNSLDAKLARRGFLRSIEKITKIKEMIKSLVGDFW